ncbi:MAG: hypothetical protein WDZ59_16780 [Pirellulales bacterium]
MSFSPVCHTMQLAILSPANSFALLGQTRGTANSALLTFFGYTLAVFLLAWFSHQVLAKRRFMSEYFLGSRGLGVLALTLTYGATSASAGSFAGFPALIYAHGWILALWIASYMIVPLCGMGLFGKRLNQVARKTGSITIPDVLRERFESRSIAILSTMLIILMLSVYLIPQFKAAGLILKALLADVGLLHRAAVVVAAWTDGVPFLHGVDPEYLICLGCFAALTIVYTTFGGFRAVVWTDVLQGFVMLFGVVAMLVLALSQVGGLSRATEKLSAMTPPELITLEYRSSQPAPTAGYRIADDVWFTMGSDGLRPRLYRTNEVGVIPPGQTVSGEVKAVRITTPEEVDRIIQQYDVPTGFPWADPVTVEIVDHQNYRYGADQPGVYVSGPGPSPSSDGGFLPLGLAVSFFFFWALSGTGQPGNMVRLMAFDTSRTLRRSIGMLSIYFGLIYFPLVIIFCCARVLSPGLDQTPDRIMPVMAFSLSAAADMPWLAGLLVAAPFAAAMSTVDSFMLMISSAVVRDVYQRNINPGASERTIKVLSYICTLVVGLAAMFGAINPPRFLQILIVFTGGGLAAGFLFPMALALYWPRFNLKGALSSMVLGIVTYIGLYIGGFVYYGRTDPLEPLSLHPLIWGFAASAIAGVVVSLSTAPPPAHLVKKFFHRDDGGK